jgi:hypothetical protein
MVSRNDGTASLGLIEYLTARQLAAWLQVSEKTVYRWAQQDPSMSVLRIAGVVRFPR